MRTRRELLLGGAALGGSLLLPQGTRAAVSPVDRKFIFVWVSGGWDPTKVFMPSMASNILETRTPGDEPATYGNLHLVANPNRPTVDTFFSRHHAKVSVLNGMLIRSINHPICRNLWMTNTTNAGRPDWPATIGYASADRYSVPHMIVAGYSMAGAYSAYTAYSGRSGKLQQLLSGVASTRGDEPHVPPPTDVQSLMDQFAATRALERSTQVHTPIEGHLTEAYKQAATRLIDFKDVTTGLDLDGGAVLATQIPLAMELLSGGVSRCVTLAHGGGAWDTHVDNSEQDPLFNDLFGGLGLLMSALESTPGRDAATLADETVVMVFSEMGRTPFLNSTGGKDHWMYSSCLLWGAGLRGGLEIGSYDDSLNGAKIDLETAETDTSGRRTQLGLGRSTATSVTPDVLGSTLLTLAGLDPAAELGADTTLRGILS